MLKENPTYRKIVIKLEKFYDDVLYYYVISHISRLFDYIRYDIPYGIKNIVYWISIVWTDRQWDSVYMLYFLRKKLILMSDNIAKNGNHVDYMKDVRQMKACIKLIDKIIEDEYGYMKAHDEKWGKIQSFFEPAYDKITGDRDPNFCIWVSGRPNANLPHEKALETEEFRIALKKEGQASVNTSKALFLIINKNFRRWWD